ncbi:MAG: SufE family protein [Porticoccaceae bacterium]
MTSNPFGTTVTSDDIIDTLGFFDGWEERYKYIIDLGRELPPMADAKKDDAHLVRGCQSQVWIDARRDGGRLWFETDSDAFIVKGLLAVVLAAYNGKRPDEVLAFDIEDYFRRLDLLRHLSPTRGNGLRAMVKRIRTMAVEAAA